MAVLGESAPLFSQMAERLADEIADGTLAEGERVPSTNELATYYRVNPATAAKGINLLSAAGPPRPASRERHVRRLQCARQGAGRVLHGVMGATLNGHSVAPATQRASGWSRQLRVTPLAPAAYVLGKAVLAMLVALPALLLVALLGAPVRHVQRAAPEWTAFPLGTWLGSIPTAALGILLGYVLDSQSAQSGTMIVYLGLSLLGGIWFPYQVMPRAMRLVARLLPSYHLASLGWNAAAGHWIGPATWRSWRCMPPSWASWRSAATGGTRRGNSPEPVGRGMSRARAVSYGREANESRPRRGDQFGPPGQPPAPARARPSPL